MLRTNLMASLQSVLLILTVVSTTTGALQTSPDSRRHFLSQSVAGGVAATTWLSTAPVLAADNNAAPQAGGVQVFKLKSGLQFIDLVEGSGPSPNYGQLCSIQYTAYLKLPNRPDKQRFDADTYLLKHGNGRLIAGLDEGLHTMKVGGQRRLIIPPKLGFVDDALGPVPESPFDRMRLNQLLADMVEQRGGNLIYDVQLLKVIDDEADQGYYDDLSLTEEQFNTLRDNIQNNARTSRGQ
jgi:FKBP-type peptidyl-prolyl cis-trans isomerase